MRKDRGWAVRKLSGHTSNHVEWRGWCLFGGGAGGGPGCVSGQAQQGERTGAGAAGPGQEHTGAASWDVLVAGS